MAPKGRGWIWPDRKDARWLLLLFLGSYVAYALSSPGYHRTAAQLAASVAVCVGLDLSLDLLVWKVKLAPLSGLVTSMGLVLLCDSPKVWPYAAVGAVSILSKHLLRLRGAHAFNPLNFGMTFGLVALASDVAVSPGRWGGGAGTSAIVLALGILAVLRARRLALAAAYVGTFLGVAALRSAASGAALATLWAPATGAAFHLFAFYMITDPKTTPDGLSEGLGFGAGVAVLDQMLRSREILHAPFYALFLASAVRLALAAGRRGDP